MSETSPTGQNSNLTDGQAHPCPECGKPGIYRVRGYKIGRTIRSHVWVECTRCEMTKRQEAEQRETTAKASRIIHAKRAAGIAGSLQARSFGGFETETGEQETALAVAGIFARDGGPAWLAFCGATGTGKSHLAVAIANEVIESYSGSVRYVKLIEMMRRFRATFHDRAGETEQYIANEYKRVRFLILDEFGARQELTEWERMTLDDILDSRWEQQRRTLIVSNMTAKAMFAAAGERIESRFAECGQIVNFTWADHRKRKVN